MNRNKVYIAPRRSSAKLSILIPAILLSFSPALQAALTYSGSVTDLDGNLWPQSGHSVVGYSADASMLLNGSTSLWLWHIYVAYGDGVDASLTMDGSGCSLGFMGNPGNLYVGNGTNSSGRVTFSHGAQLIQPTYQNHNIYLGMNMGAEAEMVVTHSGTWIYLSDGVYCGYLAGAEGRLEVKDGGLCEPSSLHVGFQAGAKGEVVVKGAGSVLKLWTNGTSDIGRSGHGSLIVKDEGLAQLRGLRVAWVESSSGDVLVTGAGSRLENSYTTAQLGPGASGVPDPEPATAIIRLARGGVFYSNQKVVIGGKDTSSTGTLVFTIGNDGSGSVVPGHAEIDGEVSLELAALQMEVDPGVALTLGQQFTLIDYQSFHYFYNQFKNIAEGDIILTPNHHAFRINYATDIGSGDLAVTATVVEPPVADGDGDGLLDAWEILCFGSTNALAGAPSLDPDGDGRDNTCEHVAGTDPLDPDSYCFIGMSNAPTASSWDLVYTPYEAAITYGIECATELATTNPVSSWNSIIPLSNTVSSGEVLFTLPGSSSDKAFYRVRISR